MSLNSLPAELLLRVCGYCSEFGGSSPAIKSLALVNKHLREFVKPHLFQKIAWGTLYQIKDALRTKVCPVVPAEALPHCRIASIGPSQDGIAKRRYPIWILEQSKNLTDQVGPSIRVLTFEPPVPIVGDYAWYAQRLQNTLEGVKHLTSDTCFPFILLACPSATFLNGTTRDLGLQSLPFFDPRFYDKKQRANEALSIFVNHAAELSHLRTFLLDHKDHYEAPVEILRVILKIAKRLDALCIPFNIGSDDIDEDEANELYDKLKRMKSLNHFDDRRSYDEDYDDWDQGFDPGSNCKCRTTDPVLSAFDPSEE